MYMCICQIISYYKGKVYICFKVLLHVVKHALWKDLSIYLKCNLMFFFTGKPVSQGLGLGQDGDRKSVSGLPRDSIPQALLSP